ncbi:hypothetical protein GCM10008914_34950 [Clostridium tertium]
MLHQLHQSDLEVEQVKIYRVAYNIMYKDELLDSIGNGEKLFHFSLFHFSFFLFIFALSNKIVDKGLT